MSNNGEVELDADSWFFTSKDTCKVDELEKWFENGPDDPNIVLIRVRAERASWWSYEDQGEIDLRKSDLKKSRPASRRRG